MRIFGKRESPLENIALIAMMAAVTAVLALVMSFFPLSSFFIIIFLPLVSVFPSLLCKDRYLPLYIIVASLVSILASLHDIGTGIFYVIPAIFSGTLFGFLIKKSLPYSLAIYLVSLLQLGFNYLSIPIIEGLTGINMITSLQTLLSLSDAHMAIVPTILFAFSLGEISLSSVATHFVLEKIGTKENKEELVILDFIIPWAGLLFIALTIIFAFASLGHIAFLSFASAIYFSLMSLPLYKKKRSIWVYVTLVILTIGGIVASIFIYPLMPSGLGLNAYALCLFGYNAVSSFLKV